MVRLFNFYVHRLTVTRVALDVLLMVFAVFVPMALYFKGHGVQVVDAVPPTVTLSAGLFLINGLSGFYERSYDRPLGQTFARGVLAMLMAIVLSFVISPLLPEDVPSAQVLAMLGATGVVVWRMVATHHSAHEATNRRRVLIYGAGPAGALVAQTLRQSDPFVEVVGHLASPNEAEVSVQGGDLIPATSDLLALAREQEVDEIIVALTERRGGSMPLRQLLDCKISGIEVWDINTHFERRLGQMRLDYVKAGWLIFGDGFEQGVARTSIKRMFDILSSLVLLVPGLPLIALAALAIRLESPGRVFYRQVRSGLHGKPFEVIKLRSMVNNAEKEGRPQWATTNDARITRVGKFIRKTRIDELPQLFNVLKGDMSMVGPRPERPFFVDQLIAELPYYAVRHSVKPGVTGWAQVRCDYGSTVDEAKIKLQYDLFYVKHHSLFLDALVMLETVGVVLTGKGAR